ncbi:MAG: hypothetical protein HKM07_08445 [Chlamydiae bacterium]|nr:hypothetical protein [Chlamydiota bacterium]
MGSSFNVSDLKSGNSVLYLGKDGQLASVPSSVWTQIGSYFWNPDIYSLSKIIHHLNNQVDIKIDPKLLGYLEDRIKEYNDSHAEQIPHLKAFEDLVSRTQRVRRNYIKLKELDASVSLDVAIKSIKNRSTADLLTEQSETDIKECIERAQYTDNRFALRRIANALFSGKRNCFHVTSVQCLRLLLCDPLSSNDDIAKLIWAAYQEVKGCDWAYLIEWEKTSSSSDKSDPSSNYGNYQNLVRDDEDGSWVRYISHCKEISEDQEVLVSHGGGLFYVGEFLRGKTVGYSAGGEYVGTGIFVSPHPDGVDKTQRDAFYACRRSPEHFDIPAHFTAKIKAKYLRAVINGYEAKLSFENVQYLEDVSIEVYNYPVPRLYGMESDIQKLPYDEGLKKRILESYARAPRG